jgi:hypothetical protein
MAVISLSKKKWARKMAKAGINWKKGVTDKAAAYKAGLARFVEGAPVGTSMVTNWDEGVKVVTPEDFQKAVAGKEDYWAAKFIEAVAR